jgi:hypothetical protein
MATKKQVQDVLWDLKNLPADKGIVRGFVELYDYRGNYLYSRFFGNIYNRNEVINRIHLRLDCEYYELKGLESNENSNTKNCVK